MHELITDNDNISASKDNRFTIFVSTLLLLLDNCKCMQLFALSPSFPLSDKNTQRTERFSVVPGSWLEKNRTEKIDTILDNSFSSTYRTLDYYCYYIFTIPDDTLKCPPEQLYCDFGHINFEIFLLKCRYRLATVTPQAETSDV